MKLAWLLWMASLMPPHAADQTCLATTVYLEARGEPVIGQMAVAEVAMRRREMKLWGDSVCDVVTAPKQFATTTVPSSYALDNLQAWNRAWAIAGQALQNWKLPRGERTDVVPHADHFVKADSPMPDWAHGTPRAVIGDHRFYAAN